MAIILSRSYDKYYCNFSNCKDHVRRVREQACYQGNIITDEDEIYPKHYVEVRSTDIEKLIRSGWTRCGLFWICPGCSHL